MTTPLGNASSHRGERSRSDTRRVRMAWFELGSNRIYFEVQGSGEPVLLIPALGVSIEEFSELRASLVMAGYQVIAADLPGCGRSEPQPRAYTASFYEEDTHTFAALLQHLESEPAHLLGFGNGGEICLLMAQIMPEVVLSVVTYGAVGTITDPGGDLRGAMCNVVDHPIPSLQKFKEYLVSTYGETNARAMTQSVAVAMSEIIKGGDELRRSKADMITCPVLLIAGENDIFASPARVCDLAAHIPTAGMLVAQGAEHFIYIERPGWLTHTILDWLVKNSGRLQNMRGMK